MADLVPTNVGDPGGLGDLVPVGLGGLVPVGLGGLMPVGLGGLMPVGLGGLVPVGLGGLMPADLVGLAGRCLRADGGMPQAADPAFLRRRWFVPGAICHGLRTADGSLVAAVAVAPTAARTIVTGLVDRAARGRGLGAWIFDHGLAVAGVGRAVTVETESATEAAVRFFASRGLAQVFAEDVMRIGLAAPPARGAPQPSNPARGDPLAGGAAVGGCLPGGAAVGGPLVGGAAVGGRLTGDAAVGGPFGGRCGGGRPVHGRSSGGRPVGG